MVCAALAREAPGMIIDACLSCPGTLLLSWFWDAGLLHHEPGGPGAGVHARNRHDLSPRLKGDTIVRRRWAALRMPARRRDYDSVVVSPCRGCLQNLPVFDETR